MPRIEAETRRAIIAAVAKGLASLQVPLAAPGSAGQPPRDGVQQRDPTDQPRGPARCK